MKTIETLVTKIKHIEYKATGGFAVYTALCVVLATVVGTAQIAESVAAWLFPYIP